MKRKTVSILEATPAQLAENRAHWLRVAKSNDPRERVVALTELTALNLEVERRSGHG